MPNYQEEKINPEIWGTEEDWIDVNNPPTLPYSFDSYIAQASLGGLQLMEAKIPYLKKATGATVPINEYWRMQWRGLFLASDADDEENVIEKLSVPMPPEDFPVVWGLGKNSPMANSYYVYPEYITGSNVQTEPAAAVSYCYKGLNTLYSPSNLDGENEWTDAKPIPFCFTSQQGSSNTINFRYRNYAMGVGQSYVAAVGGISGNPILSFNYQNVVIYPLLIIAKENEDSNYGYDFQYGITIGAYFDGVNYDPDEGTGTPPLQQTYPYICCVYVGDIRIGANDGTVRGGNNGGSIFGGIAPGLFDLNEVESLEMEYKGQVRGWTTQLLSAYQGRNQFQAITKSILTDGIISGSKSGNTMISFQMQGRSRLDTPDKAWIALTADSTSPTLPVFFQNSHYEPVLRQRRNFSNPNASYTNYLDFIPLWHDATKEDVLKDVAYLGFWFSEDGTTAGNSATGEDCIDPLMHIPVFDEYGITTGEYKSGTEAAQEPNAKWQDPFKDNPYKPGDGPTPPAPEEPPARDSGYLNSQIPARGDNTAGLSFWVCGKSQLYLLHEYLNGTYLPTPDDNTANFKGSNPIDYIISCQKYPFPLPFVTTPDTICVGKVDTQIQANPFYFPGLNINSVVIKDFGKVSLHISTTNPMNLYGDFRDYETRIIIQLPFIGSFDLDPRVYMYHDVGLKYNIDYNTGAVAALVYRDNLITEIFTGQISITVPFTASNMGAFQNSLASLEFASQQAKIKQIAGIGATAIGVGAGLASIVATGGASLPAVASITGGIISGASTMASGFTQQEQLKYEIENISPSCSSISTASAANAFFTDDKALLLLYRPSVKYGDETAYAKTVGHACCDTGRVSDFTGLIKVSQADLSGIPATLEELKLIDSYLSSGVYV